MLLTLGVARLLLAEQELGQIPTQGVGLDDEFMAGHDAASSGMVTEAVWRRHDRLIRGQAFAVFTGLDFKPALGESEG